MENKPGHPAYNPKYSLDFNMGMADIDRLHWLLIELHKLSVSVQCRDFSSLEPYYATLMEFYGCLSPIIKNADDKKDIKKEIDYFNPIITKIRLGKAKAIDNEDLERLRNFQFKLLHIKQWSGLGFPVSKEMTESQKLKRFIDE